MSDWFEFAPWERFSPDFIDGEADFRGEFRFNGERRTLVFKRVGDFVFFREALKSDAEWNFSPYNYGDFGAGDWSIRAQKSIQAALRRGFIRRLWQWKPLDRSGALRVSHTPDHGWEICDTKEFSRSFRLRFDLDKRAAMEWPSSQIWNRLQNEWEDPDSEMRFTAHFLDQSEENQNLYAFQTASETPQAMADWLRTALHAFHPTWQGAANVSVCLTPGLDARIQLDDGLFTSSSDGRWLETIKPPLRERAILEHLVRFYAPTRRAPDDSMPLALRHFCKHYGRLDGFESIDHLTVSASAPTMHERIEALNRLHGWIEQHWPQGARHLERVMEG